METLYTTGKFAKMANVSERTIRFYDKIGLLTPSFVMENGYRKYSDKDFLKLQKILSLKQLGFSIKEILPLLINEEDNLKDSFSLQRKLISKRIAQLQVLHEALKMAEGLAEKGELNWNRVMELVRLTNIDAEIVEQYKSTANLNARIELHDQFSTNHQNWFDWLYGQINFKKVYRLLEVGCGNGKLWQGRKIDLRNREFFLSDSSIGMVEEVRNQLGKNFNCIYADCDQIPFKDAYFDALIANHVLFYLKDLEKGLHEITRVLTTNGILYCSTYGTAHMKEISELVRAFDSRIILSKDQLANRFGLDNGEAILKRHFRDVKKVVFPDKLMIDDMTPLFEYILSCHGNQIEIIGTRMNEFKQFLVTKLQAKGVIEITKEAGLFICKK